MTTTLIGRRQRRYAERCADVVMPPVGWAFADLLRGRCIPSVERGKAKPGRGGRRKRKADRAKIRARIGAGVERKGWPLSWSRRIMVVKSPARMLTDREIAGLASGPPFILPMGFELQCLEPARHPGRRERRRRAKLRRRRARRRAGWTTIPMAPGMWAAITKAFLFKRWSVATRPS